MCFFVTKHSTISEGKSGRKTILNTILSTSSDTSQDESVQRIVQKFGKMDQGEIKANTAILILAGYETTSTALSWLLHHISGKPEIQKAMREEVTSVFGTPYATDWTFEMLENTVFNEETFPIIQAVIRESFRLNPPSVILGEENIVPTEVRGKSFPAGTK